MNEKCGNKPVMYNNIYCINILNYTFVFRYKNDHFMEHCQYDKKKIIVEILHWHLEFFWAWPLIFSYCIRIFNRCDVKVL